MRKIKPTENGSSPIKVKTQLLYSLSEFASNPMVTVTMSFLTFFYTDKLGLNAGLVGAIILISKIFDGFSDIFAGNIIDHTHVKSGSARPWILWTAIPLALSYILLFTVPNCGNIGRALYIFVSYNFAVTIAYTLFNSALNALPIYMSDDTKSRSSAYSIRLIIAGLVQVVLSTFFLNIVKSFGDDQSAWIKISAILATVSFAACLIVYFTVREKVTVQSPLVEKDNVSLITALKSVLQNKYWFMALGVTLIVTLHQVSTLTVGVYYAKYILFDETLAGNLILYHHAGGAVGMLIMPFFLQRGGSKRNATLVGGILMLVGGIVGIISTDTVPLIISLALRGCGFGIASGTYYGMLADSVEYGEYKTGISTKAVTTCAAGAGQKLGSGLGTALFGFVLEYLGYDGLKSVQVPAAVSGIKFMFIVLPIILYIALIVIMYFYKLDKEYPSIHAELLKRKEASISTEV